MKLSQLLYDKLKTLKLHELNITIIRETHIKNMYWKPHILTG